MSKGLWGHIQDNQGVARAITTEEVKKGIDGFLSGLHVPYKTEKTEFILYTGKAGADIVAKEIQKSNDRDFVDFLETKKLITTEEKERIKQMIDSTDEDYHLAKCILEIKSTELVSNHLKT